MKVFLFFFGVFVGMALMYPAQIQDPEIKIVKEYKPIIKYKYRQEQVFNDPEILKNCYSSPIVIETEISDDMMTIIAHDACKQTQQDIKLEVSQKDGWKFKLTILAAAIGCSYLLTRL